MKNRDLKKLLKNEGDILTETKRLKETKQALRLHPYDPFSSEIDERINGNTAAKLQIPFGMYLVLFTLILLLISIVVLFVYINSKIQMPSAPNYVNVKNYTYVSMDINPSISFTLDEHNSVIAFSPENDDAKTMLLQEHFSGFSIENACMRVCELAYIHGYFNFDRTDNAVLFFVANENNSYSQNLALKLCDVTEEFFKSNSLIGVSLYDTGDQSQSQVANNYNISVGKLSYLQKIIQAFPTYDFDELVTLSIKELNALYMAEAQKDDTVEQHIYQSFENERNALDALFDEQTQTLRYAIDLRKLLENTSDANNSAVLYQLYDQLEKLEITFDTSSPPSVSELQHLYYTFADSYKYEVLDWEYRLAEESKKSYERLKSNAESRIVSISILRDGLNAEQIYQSFLEACTEDWFIQRKQDLLASWYDFKSQWKKFLPY